MSEFWHESLYFEKAHLPKLYAFLVLTEVPTLFFTRSYVPVRYLIYTGLGRYFDASPDVYVLESRTNLRRFVTRRVSIAKVGEFGTRD